MRVSTRENTKSGFSESSQKSKQHESKKFQDVLQKASEDGSQKKQRFGNSEKPTESKTSTKFVNENKVTETKSGESGKPKDQKGALTARSKETPTSDISDKSSPESRNDGATTNKDAVTNKTKYTNGSTKADAKSIGPVDSSQNSLRSRSTEQPIATPVEIDANGSHEVRGGQKVNHNENGYSILVSSEDNSSFIGIDAEGRAVHNNQGTLYNLFAGQDEKRGSELIFQRDGNLVLRDSTGSAIGGTQSHEYEFEKVGISNEGEIYFRDSNGQTHTYENGFGYNSGGQPIGTFSSGSTNPVDNLPENVVAIPPRPGDLAAGNIEIGAIHTFADLPGTGQDHGTVVVTGNVGESGKEVEIRFPNGEVLSQTSYNRHGEEGSFIFYSSAPIGEGTIRITATDDNNNVSVREFEYTPPPGTPIPGQRPIDPTTGDYPPEVASSLVSAFSGLYPNPLVDQGDVRGYINNLSQEIGDFNKETTAALQLAEGFDLRYLSDEALFNLAGNLEGNFNSWNQLGSSLVQNLWQSYENSNPPPDEITSRDKLVAGLMIGGALFTSGVTGGAGIAFGASTIQKSLSVLTATTGAGVPLTPAIDRLIQEDAPTGVSITPESVPVLDENVLPNGGLGAFTQRVSEELSRRGIFAPLQPGEVDGATRFDHAASNLDTAFEGGINSLGSISGDLMLANWVSHVSANDTSSADQFHIPQEIVDIADQLGYNINLFGRAKYDVSIGRDTVSRRQFGRITAGGNFVTDEVRNFPSTLNHGTNVYQLELRFTAREQGSSDSQSGFLDGLTIRYDHDSYYSIPDSWNWYDRVDDFDVGVLEIDYR